MAASPGVPAIGTKYGPCPASHGCEHRDCIESRRTADHICRICGHAIGYETRYYTETPIKGFRPPVHALCLELENE
jgi:hypothetical protein